MHDLLVMGSNPAWVELGEDSASVEVILEPKKRGSIPTVHHVHKGWQIYRAASDDTFMNYLLCSEETVLFKWVCLL